MKIVIASGIYLPDIGGPATYSQLIAREFSKRGIEVVVICYSDKKIWLTDRDEKFKIKRISRKHNTFFRYWLYFWNLLKIAKNCDVIYAQGPLAAGFPAMLVSKILRKRFIIKIVGDYAWEQAANQFGVKDLIEDFQKNKYGAKIERIRKIQKFVVKKADKIIVPSEFLRRIVKGWDTEKNRIIVIYNAGPEIKDIKPKSLTGDVIISAGRLEPWKGMDILVTIMPDLLRINPNFRLIIIGQGPQEENIKFQITNFKLDDRVKLVDKLSHEELMAYFKASRIFVLNSAYEGLPHIVLEAMAYGLPVITTNIGGNPEVVQDGYNGLLVEYNNKEQIKEAILKLWGDEELQKKFIENGYKTLEKFSLKEMINKTLKALFEKS